MRAARCLLDALRGALIGLVEIVPGMSGGTMALILGVYETLIDGAGQLARGLVHLGIDPLRGRGTAEARRTFAAVPWAALLPIGAGMLLAVLAAARLLAPLVERHPEQSRAVVAGLILVSVSVPARMVGGRWRPREWLAAVAAAVAAFVLTGLPAGAATDPALWVVALAAAAAICALVLPGVSGAFILLTLGLYEPTLRAVSDRDLPYLAAFAVGAILGLGAFVHLLRWLLRYRRRVTLAIMAGLMAGSLRALWPWQSESGAAQAPDSSVAPLLVLFGLGAAAVVVLLVAEAALERRRLVSTTTLDPAAHSQRPARS